MAMSNHLENVELLDLVDRYNYLIKEYVQLSMEIAPKLEKFGKHRNELQIISAEFVRRGYQPSEPDGLKRMVEEELGKRKSTVDGVTQTDQNEGNTESRQDPK